MGLAVLADHTGAVYGEHEVRVLHRGVVYQLIVAAL